MKQAFDEASPDDRFLESNLPEPHRSRSLGILRRHPEVKELFGRNRATALLIVMAVTFQLGAAYLMRDAAPWLILLAAWCVGAFATHATFCLYHECAHQLVFRRKWANHLLGIFANLPQLLPSYASFRVYHLKHHQYQGDHALDADLASHWEARLIGHSTAGKVLWEIFFPFFQCARSFRFSRNRKIPFWGRSLAVLQHRGPVGFARGPPALRAEGGVRLPPRELFLQRGPAPAGRAVGAGALRRGRGARDLQLLRPRQPDRHQHRLPQRAPRLPLRAVESPAAFESHRARGV